MGTPSNKSKQAKAKSATRATPKPAKRQTGKTHDTKRK